MYAIAFKDDDALQALRNKIYNAWESNIILQCINTYVLDKTRYTFTVNEFLEKYRLYKPESIDIDLSNYTKIIVVLDSTFSKLMAPIGKFLEHVLEYNIIYMPREEVYKFDGFAEILK